MTLALDPRLPLLWRTPASVQLGVDDPPVTLTEVTTAHERMLAGLAIGLTPEGLLLIGTESGLNREQVDEFTRHIQPALVQVAPSTSACVEIDGCGPTADRLDWRLREAGMEPRRPTTLQRKNPPPQPTSSPDFAIIVGDYVLDPDRRGRWLRRDIPHLPIIFNDTSVTLGPFIEPGTGPCLYCLELHRRDADPAWPALASQLLGRKSTAQSPFVASEVATLATRLVMVRVLTGRGTSSIAITLDVATGQLSRRSGQPHADCACSEILPVNEQDRQETVTENSLPAAGRLKQTTKDEELSVPA